MFYGSEMRIYYSRGEKSKALLRRELGEEAVLEADLERSKTTLSRRVEEGGTKRGLFSNQPQAEEEEEQEETRSKRIKLESPDTAVVTARNIPRTIEHNVIETLFGTRDGFKTITSVEEEDESWTAQIAFDTKQNAEAAAAALHGVQLDPVYTLDLSVV